MKFFTFGFLVFGFISSSLCLTKEEGMEMAKALLNECKNQEGGTDADVDLLIQMTYPTTHEGKCMVACTHEKMGLVSFIKIFLG
jgi:hypothetical protein